MSHVNDGNCAKCEEIFNRYPGFHADLKAWFKLKQKNQPMLHISGAGRGEAEQNLYFLQKKSDAPYGKSAHNYGAGIDMWFQCNLGVYSLPEAMFDKYVMPNMPSWITWYGRPEVRHMTPSERRAAKQFYELPHAEVKTWRDMVSRGELKLVEPKTEVKLARS